MGKERLEMCTDSTVLAIHNVARKKAPAQEQRPRIGAAPARCLHAVPGS